MVFKRKTVISEQLVQLLQKAKEPLNNGRLLDELKSYDLQPNKTTVYRILDKLVDKGVVQVMTLKNGVRYFEWDHGQKHHHHFFCGECETVYCLDACQLNMSSDTWSNVLPDMRFQVDQHDFNLYGRCGDCVDKGVENVTD